MEYTLASREEPMNKLTSHLRDTAITIGLLCAAFFISVLLQSTLEIPEQVTTTFACAVFVISTLTDGYVYGIVAAFISTIAINYAFTFPYFGLNFTIPTNFFSAIVMLLISVPTSALTTKVKRQKDLKAETEKERMRANLLRAVSHDLRTPLTTIYSSSTALLENRDTMSPLQQEKILQGIKEDSEWLTRMVENLLSITRIDSGRVKIDTTPVVLEELIDTVILKFKKRYPAQHLELDIPDELTLISMDPILIEQVILNLLENAVQHASGMTELSLNVFTHNKQAVFEIRDNGCGIREDKLPRIFTGNDVADDLPADSRKRNAGIGLSVCATIVKAHGGEISAENNKTGGALFRFTLNLEDSDYEQ